MGTLRNTFPELADEIARSLHAAAQPGLLEDVESARITGVTYDNEADAGYVYVDSERPLNVVEQNVIRVRHGSTVTLESTFWINLDVDNHDRLRGVEIISPPAGVKARLREFAA